MSTLAIFITIAAFMIVAACASLVVPLIRAGERPAALAAGTVIAALPLATLGLYLAFSNWTWDEQPHESAPPQQAAALGQVVGQLEQRLRDVPDDLQGWIMLGRSYAVMGRFQDGVQAYRQARELSDDQSVEALTGYAEALAVSQGNSIGDESMALFERALQMSPDDRKALWYGGLGALERGQPAVARQRWQRLLQLNPPEQMAQLLRDQIALTGGQTGQMPEAAPADGAKTLTIAIELDESLRQGVPGTAPVFVLARPAGGGGPPLAAVRRSVADLPLTVQLSDADAMMPGRELSAFDEVEVVARIALGGTPVAQAGDLYGSVLAGNDGSVNIVIDKVH